MRKSQSMISANSGCLEQPLSRKETIAERVNRRLCSRFEAVVLQSLPQGKARNPRSCRQIGAFILLCSVCWSYRYCPIILLYLVCTSHFVPMIHTIHTLPACMWLIECLSKFKPVDKLNNCIAFCMINIATTYIIHTQTIKQV